MDIGDDMPMSLDQAAEGPLRGLVTASTLRAAIAAGTLPAARLGKRYVVTRAGLNEWIAACRVLPKGHTSTSGARPQRPEPCGSSGTVDTSTAQASLEMTLNRLMTPVSKQPSGNTSPRGTRPAPASVTPIRSR